MTVLARLLPSVDRPPEGAVRCALWLLLLCDAAVLVLLPHAAVVAGCVAAAAFAALMGSRLSRAIALLAVGYPLFDPFGSLIGDAAPVFFALRMILLGAVVWMIFTTIRRPGSLLAAFVSDPIVLSGLALGVIVALGTLFTPAPIYGRQKVGAYLATNLPLLAAGYLLARRHDAEDPARPDARLESLLLAIGVLGLILSAVAILNALIQFYPYGSRLTVLGMNPIWLARIMGIAILAVLSLADCGRIRNRTAVLLSAPLFAVLVLTGSRGPFLGLLLVIAMRMLVFTRASSARRVGLALAGVVVAAGAFLAMPEELRDRFLHPMGVDLSGAVRVRFLEIAREALSHMAGWGTGTGGFSDLLGKGDFRLYPHNLIAEVGIENGLPGLVALILFFVTAGVRGLRGWIDPRTRAAALCFLFAFWNAQFSGDLTANEWIWLFAGLIAGRTR